MTHDELMALPTEYMFEVWQDDMHMAGGSAPTLREAVAEADHYALMYGQDGPVSVRFYAMHELPQAAIDAAREGEG